MPVKIAASDGLHDGAAQEALVKSILYFARRSKCGVRACG